MKIAVADRNVLALERMLTDLILQMRDYRIMSVGELDCGYQVKLGVLDDIRILERICRQLQRHHGGIGFKLVRDYAVQTHAAGT